MAAVLDTAEVQEAVDQPKKAHGIAVHDLHLLPATPALKAFFQSPQDQGQGGPEFMADIRKENRFSFIDGFQGQRPFPFPLIGHRVAQAQRNLVCDQLDEVAV